MITSMVLTVLLASLFFVFAALCAEAGLLALGKPLRFAWIAAIAASTGVPFVPFIVSALDTSAAPTVTAIAQPLQLITIATHAAIGSFNDASMRDVETWFIRLWICTSFLLGVRLLLARHALNRRARNWERGEVAGVPVWISQSFGPAVIGLWEPEIVVPRRVTQLSPEDQRLALAHEVEHIAAKDQWFIRAAALAVVALPWNVFLWVAVRRLRSAIEIDCDTRVLRSAPNADAYASLVLSVAAWPRELRSEALALGETAIQQLERRLRLMAKESRTRRPFAGLVLLSMALALTVYACGNAARVEQPRPQVHTLPVVVITAVTTARPFTEFQVDKPVSHKYGNAAPRYPDSLRATGIEGEVLAQFVVNANGHVEIASLKILNSPHELFVRAVQDALLQMRFHPAEVKGNRVRQLVQQPFEFGLAR